MVEVSCYVECPDFGNSKQQQKNKFLTFSTNLAEVNALVVEHLDAVRPVVGDEDLLAVVDDDPVGELEVLRAAKLVEHVAQLVEDDHPHHLDKVG